MCYPETDCLSGSCAGKNDVRVWRHVAGELWGLLKGHPNRPGNVARIGGPRLSPEHVEHSGLIPLTQMGPLVARGEAPYIAPRT